MGSVFEWYYIGILVQWLTEILFPVILPTVIDFIIGFLCTDHLLELVFIVDFCLL